MTDRPKKTLGERAAAWTAAHKFDATLEQYQIKGRSLVQHTALVRGWNTWDLAGAKAEFQHGANIGGRVTLTRIALTGPFALAMKKDRNKVYVIVQLDDEEGSQVMIEAKAKLEMKARQFAEKINGAGKHYAENE